MSRFASIRGLKRPTVGAPDTTNLAGGSAFKQNDKLALASLLLTSKLTDTYYESGSDQLARLTGLFNNVDPQWAAKAAVFARNEWGLRSVTHALAVLVARFVKGESWTRPFFRSVVRRVDDMTEIMGLYIACFGKPIPNSLKRGLADAFSKFDRYQLSKYKGETHGLSLVDLVNIVHPLPSIGQGDALCDLVRGTLVSTDTWEAKLSAAGTKRDVDVAKKEAWSELVRGQKIGYFALLRNLRNILEQAPGLIPDVCRMLTNEKLIKKSLVFPFRFTSALAAVGNNRDLVVALNNAIDISVSNVPDLPGTLVAVDASDSMGHDITANRGIGTLLGVVLAKKCSADFMIFGSDAAMLNYNPLDSTSTIFSQFMKHNQYSYHYNGAIQVGHGTNFPAIFKKATKKYERIFIFSDMQGWMGGGAPIKDLREYEQRTKSKPFIYSMDLSGHGTMMFPDDRVVAIPGFSEKIFDVVKVIESDKDALIKMIDSVKFI